MGNSLEQHRASIGAFNASSKRRRRIFASRSSNLVPIAAPIHLQLQQKQFSSNLMAQPMKELSNRHLQIQQWEENAKTDSEAGFRKQAKLVDNILEHTSRQVNQSKIVSENNWQGGASIWERNQNEVEGNSTNPQKGRGSKSFHCSESNQQCEAQSSTTSPVLSRMSS